MTVLDITSLASSIYGEPVTTATAKTWINEALQMLGSQLYNMAETQIDVTDASLTYILPSDFIQVDQVLTERGVPYRHWEAWGKNIKFAHRDRYTVRYYRTAAQVSADTDQPDCHILFHPAFAYYIIYREESKYMPGDAEANYWYNEFLARIGQAVSQIQKRPRRILTGRWA